MGSSLQVSVRSPKAAETLRWGEGFRTRAWEQCSLSMACFQPPCPCGFTLREVGGRSNQPGRGLLFPEAAQKRLARRSARVDRPERRPLPASAALDKRRGAPGVPGFQVRVPSPSQRGTGGDWRAGRGGVVARERSPGRGRRMEGGGRPRGRAKCRNIWEKRSARLQCY